MEEDSDADPASAEGRQRGVDTVEAPGTDEEAEQLIERRQSHAEASTQGEPWSHKLSACGVFQQLIQVWYCSCSCWPQG